LAKSISLAIIWLLENVQSSLKETVIIFTQRYLNKYLW